MPRRPAVPRLVALLGLALAAGGLSLAAPASAQLLGGGLPGLPSPGLPDLSSTRLPDTRAARGGLPRLATPEVVGSVGDVAAGALQQVRQSRLAALIRDNPGVIDVDDQGAAVLRGQVLAISPTPRALAAAQAAGFTVRDRSDLAGLDIALVMLETPSGLSAREAVRRLRQLDPAGQYDFNHIYLGAGAGAVASGSQGPGAALSSGSKARIGLVDGGVDAGHPALRGAHLEQKPFAPGGLAPSAHGLAVASLLVGASVRFHGAAPGADLYVADVYGATPAGGSAQALSRALAWLAQVGTPVINVSLVGPPNITLQAVVRALVARGYLIVAAVGNDGPAAAPLYPASYPGVVAVTAVDAGGRLLPEAGRARHLDFAAPGSNMAAAGPGGGFVSVRGTSFAAPLVAGRLALELSRPDPQAASRAVAALGREARDLGPRGPDLAYGRGLIGADLVVSPRAVGAKGMLASQ